MLLDVGETRCFSNPESFCVFIVSRFAQIFSIDTFPPSRWRRGWRRVGGAGAERVVLQPEGVRRGGRARLATGGRCHDSGTIFAFMDPRKGTGMGVTHRPLLGWCAGSGGPGWTAVISTSSEC